MSGRLAPSPALPQGMPAPSVSNLRLVPLLARSVGLGPVPVSPQRGLGHGPVPRLPLPVEADGGIVVQQSCLPQLLEDPSSLPLWKAIVHGAARAQAPRQGLPLAAGPPHGEEGVQGLAVVHAGPPASGLGRGEGQHFLEVGP